MEDAEIKSGAVENADLDIFYWHVLNEFQAIKGGINYYYRPARHPYWQPGIGAEGQMPYFIDTNLRIYTHAGSTKLDLILSRENQLLNNFFVRTQIRGIFATATAREDFVGSGVNEWQFTLMPYYRLAPGLSVFAKYEYQMNEGVTQNLLKNTGESTAGSTISAGATVLF